MDYTQHSVRDPRIWGGEPVLRGTRVTVRAVIASLAEGATVEQIMASFPTLEHVHTRAVIANAAACVQEDVPITAVSATP